ncbi:MAG TPA: hypothetical protein VL574_15700 [Stellaceae bacterium]|jgi:hypothetical protein|nr:hypothetical protein [Stellaceae bacterium]
MRIRVDRQNGVHLDEPEDFRRFSLAVERGKPAMADISRALAGIATLEDEGSAWVSETALRQWPGLAGDRGWDRGLSAMIEKARPFGWYDPAHARIKAHVEWLAA